jgi:hypothetical protein
VENQTAPLPKCKASREIYASGAILCYSTPAEFLMLFEQEIAAQQERAQDAIAQVLAEWKSLRRLSGEVRQRKELPRRSARTELVSELLLLPGFRRKYFGDL